MTYPPQPPQPGQPGQPYGQQPDPYGQQPPSGGFPQQPYPQQGGWDPNAPQQPYPTQQYPAGWDPNQQAPQSGGFPQQPAPVWDPNQQQQQGWDPNQQQYGQPYGQQYGQPQPGWDPNAAGQVSGWDPAAGGYGQGFGGPPAPPKKSQTGLWIAIGAVVVLVLAGLGITGFVAPGFFLSKSDEAGQVKTTPTPTAPKTSSPKTTGEPSTKASTPSGTGGTAAKGSLALQGFIDKLNAGDTNGALALGCADSKTLLSDWLKTFLKEPLDLKLGDVPNDDYLVEGQVTGTSAGKPVKGTLSATNFDDKGWCVSTMLVS